MSVLFRVFLLTICVFINNSAVVSIENVDNWAVILSTSRYWFNYRHLANALSIYNTVKSLGIPDSRIIFLNTLDIINDARNPFRGEMYSSDTMKANNLVVEDLEVDYTGNEVNVELFSRLLTNRLSSSTPKSKRLLTTNNSNILIYMSGHGGDEFFKFHDVEELSSQHLGSIFNEMHLKQRYRSILLILETCQAVTMTNHLMHLPNIITLSSSLKGENSYAYGSNKELGVAVVDRFTHSINEYFQKNLLSNKNEKQYCASVQRSTLYDLWSKLDPSFLFSTATIMQSTGRSSNGGVKIRDSRDILLMEYFGNYLRSVDRCSNTTLLAGVSQ